MDSTLSNVSSSNGTTVLIGPTVVELVICGLTTMIVGLFGTVVNVITILAIRQNKHLHLPCFILIGTHAFYGWIMAVGCTTAGIHYLGLGLHYLTAIYPRYFCYLVYLAFIFSFHPSSVVTFLVALERMLAIVCPIAYQNSEKWILRLGLISAVLVAVGVSIAAIGTAIRPLHHLIKCYNVFSSLEPNFAVFFSHSSFGLQVLAVVCYGLMYAMVQYNKYKRTSVQSTTEEDQFLQRQLKLLPLINTLTIAYTIFGVGPPLIATAFADIAGGVYLVRAGFYVITLKSGLPCIDFCVLMTKSKEFRQTVIKMMRRRKKNQVGVQILTTYPSTSMARAYERA